MKKFLIIFAAVMMVFTAVSCESEPYHSHEWVEKEVKKEATCVDDGSILYECKECKETKIEIVNALGHDFVDGVCSRCNVTEDVVNAAAARIGLSYYSNLKDAFTALKAGDTLTLLKDYEYTNLYDMDINNALTVSVPCTIEGNNKRIFTNLSNSVKKYRLLNILNLKDGEVIVRNLSLSSVAESTYYCGLYLASNENAHIILENVDIQIPDYYAIDIVKDNINLKMTMKNDCLLQGWCTLNNHTSNLNLEAFDCVFNSHNKHTGPTNGFCNIIVADYYYGNVSEKSQNNTMKFESCTFSTTKDHQDVTQPVFDLRCPANNKLYLDNCSFLKVAEKINIESAFDTDWRDSMEERNQFEFSNKVYIDGIDVTNDKNMVNNYLDKEINKIEDYAGNYPYNPILVLFEVPEGESDSSIKINDGNSDYLLTSKKTLDNPETWNLTVQKIVQ